MALFGSRSIDSALCSSQVSGPFAHVLGPLARPSPGGAEVALPAAAAPVSLEGLPNISAVLKVAIQISKGMEVRETVGRSPRVEPRPTMGSRDGAASCALRPGTQRVAPAPRHYRRAPCAHSGIWIAFLSSLASLAAGIAQRRQDARAALLQEHLPQARLVRRRGGRAPSGTR